MDDAALKDLAAIRDEDQRAAHRANANNARLEHLASLLGRGVAYDEAVEQANTYHDWIIELSEELFFGGANAD